MDGSPGNGWLRDLINGLDERISRLEAANEKRGEMVGEIRGGLKTWAIFLGIVGNALLTLWLAYRTPPVVQDDVSVKQVLERIERRQIQEKEASHK